MSFVRATRPSSPEDCAPWRFAILSNLAATQVKQQLREKKNPRPATRSIGAAGSSRHPCDVIGGLPSQRNATLTLAIAVTALLLIAASATAEVTRKKAMWGPLEVNGASQFPVYADLGVGIYQSALGWADVAKQRPLNPRDPSDPAYS
jgi:hypothetical protein